MIDGEIIKILERCAVALERIADKIAPVEVQREKRPATLSKAIYSREERERQELRQKLKGTTPQPQG